MSAFRFLHAADIHLDSPMRRLEQYPGAPVEAFRGATRRALEKLVDLAILERVDFVLIAGDLYDVGWECYKTPLFFCEQMAKLGESGIPVYLIRGNHDALNESPLRFKLPPNVHMMGHEQADSFPVDGLGVVVHGQSFGTRRVPDNLALGYPAKWPGHFNLGMLHTSLEGRPGHDSYSPCKLDDLRVKGYDYWALGHVHTRESLHPVQPIHFAGNTQGRHIGEPGPKGCLLVTVDGRGGPPSVAFKALDVLRWATCRVDGRGLDDDDMLHAVAAAIDEAAEGAGDRYLAVRVAITEADGHDQHFDAERLRAEVQRVARERTGGRTWVERVERRFAPVPREAAEGPIGEILDHLAALEQDRSALKAICDDILKALKKKLPNDFFEGDRAMALDAGPRLLEALDGARRLLIGGLAPAPGGERS